MLLFSDDFFGEESSWLSPTTTTNQAVNAVSPLRTSNRPVYVSSGMDQSPGANTDEQSTKSGEEFSHAEVVAGEPLELSPLDSKFIYLPSVATIPL